MLNSRNIFWDTCVFGAYFYDDRGAYGSSIDDIAQYIDEAKRQKWQIISSSLLFAEFAFSKVKNSKIGKIEDLFEDIQSFCTLVEPNPNIMQLAGKLRAVPYKKTIAQHET